MVGRNIKLNINGKIVELQVMAEDVTTKGTFYFCECKDNNSHRGFYSTGYITSNSSK